MTSRAKHDQAPAVIIDPAGIRPIDQEPWVYLPDATDLSAWDKEAEIAANQRVRQTLKYAFYRLVFDFLSDSDIAGDYFEFGVHRARTFRMALSSARLHNRTDMEFHAFDSFAGLPDVGNPVIDKWQPGALCTSKAEFIALIDSHGLFIDKICTHEGYFADVLTANFCSEFSARGRKAAMITVDCDFYESSVPVFEFVPNVLQHGTVIYLDDVFNGFKTSSHGGMMRAFQEMAAKSTWQFEPYLDVGWWGRSFIARAI